MPSQPETPGVHEPDDEVPVHEPGGEVSVHASGGEVRLDEAGEELLAAARAARANAHAPYSGFAVGAAVRTGDGSVFTGVNVENASYPEGVCAETAALAAMAGAGRRDLVAVAVVADGEAPVTPCGGCRQRLAEFGSDATEVIIGDDREAKLVTTLGELLPLRFTSHSAGEAAGDDDA